MTEILRIDNLTQYFTSGSGVFRKGYTVKAVDGVSLYVSEGETLGLVGESGCGKSTLGRTILKLYQPTSGEIYFQGNNITQLSDKAMRPLRKEMQIIFQDPLESLNQRHSIGMIIEEPFIIHNIGNKQERRIWVEELLEKVGLPKECVNRYPHEFSGGQRQRVGIARAIALKPKLLICDESVSALDVSVQAQIIALLMKLQKEMNLAMIFISHDLSVIRQISDRVAVMLNGKIIEEGSVGELFEAAKEEYSRTLLAAIPASHPKNRRRK